MKINEIANKTTDGRKGNKNATKNRPWSDAIRRAAARRKGGLNRLADQFIEKVAEGDTAAVKEFGDRFEGKIPQAIEGAGESGDIIIRITSNDRNVL